MANRSAVARRLRVGRRDVTLLCAGQRGDIAVEDLLGAGSILEALGDQSGLELYNDASWLSLELYQTHRDHLGEVFRRCLGARTELARGLEQDIDFCAVRDRFDVVGVFDGSKTIRKLWV